MTAPRISVILPVYNAAPFVAEAITSVLHQTFADFELLILDDGSTDDSLPRIRVAAGNDPRVRIITRENRGLVSTLNEAIALAQGEYLARMDADDISLPDRFAKQLASLEATPHVSVLGSWVERIGAESGLRPYPADAGAAVGALVFRNPLAHPTVMMRRSLFTQHAHAYEATARHTEDYALWLAVCRTSLIANLPEVLLRYRVHPKQVSALHANEQELRTVLLQLTFLDEHLGVHATLEEAAVHRALAFSRFEVSETFVHRAEAWLVRLAEANESSGRFPREGFVRTLVGRFVSLRHFARGCGLPVSQEIPPLFQPRLHPRALD